MAGAVIGKTLLGIGAGIAVVGTAAAVAVGSGLWSPDRGTVIGDDTGQPVAAVEEPVDAVAAPEVSDAETAAARDVEPEGTEDGSVQTVADAMPADPETGVPVDGADDGPEDASPEIATTETVEAVVTSRPLSATETEIVGPDGSAEDATEVADGPEIVATVIEAPSVSAETGTPVIAPDGPAFLAEEAADPVADPTASEAGPTVTGPVTDAETLPEVTTIDDDPASVMPDVAIAPLASGDVPSGTATEGGPATAVTTGPASVAVAASVEPPAETGTTVDATPDVAGSTDPDAVVADAPVVPSGETRPPEASIAAPHIDVARIEPDGRGIVAGTGPAGARVEVLVNDAVLTDVVVDDSGAFVAFLTLPPSDAPRVLSLNAVTSGGQAASAETIILGPTTGVAPLVAAAVPLPPQTGLPGPGALSADEAPAPIAPEVEGAEARAAAIPAVTFPGVPDPAPPHGTEPQEVAAVTDPAVLPPANAPAAPAEVGTLLGALSVPDTTAPPVPAFPVPAGTTAEADPAAPVPGVTAEAPARAVPVVGGDAPLPVLIADAGGVRVLQPRLAPGADPEVLRTVALDAIAYDPAGDVQLAGRASGGGTVRLYLDNRFVLEAVVATDGTWETGLPGIETGTYVLRVDQVDASGEVISRIETPFRREERDTIAAVLAEETSEPDFQVAVRTVQPGNTLWGISQDRYGEGILYVRVFDANRDLIRDPDLIFPGQILRLPE